jgi:hypothetical protein
VSRCRSVLLGLGLVVSVGALCASALGYEASAHGRVHPLAVAELKTPRIRSSCVTGITVGGRYPQVFDEGVPLRAVNAALRAAALVDERWLISGGCPAGPDGPPPADYMPHPGIESRISASSVVVSALMFAASAPPGANFSYDWTAVTVRVATATRVTLAALFRSPRKGLEALAAVARARLSAQMSGSCWVRSPTPTGIAPTPSNYRYFALATHGLALGFTAGAVDPQDCGPLLITIPYTVLHPYLSSLGRQLIAGVRQPLK